MAVFAGWVPIGASRPYFVGTLAEQTATRINDIKPEGEGIRQRTIGDFRRDDASNFLFADEIGIGAAVTRRPLPHHRAYGSVHGGSSRLR